MLYSSKFDNIFITRQFHRNPIIKDTNKEQPIITEASQEYLKTNNRGSKPFRAVSYVIVNYFKKNQTTYISYKNVKKK